MRKSKNNGANRRKAEASKEGDDLRQDAGGYDWGWPYRTAAVGNFELPQRFAAGGFAGCAYGLTAPNGPPFIALIGTEAQPMRSALALLRKWVDLDGPSAINLEVDVREHDYSVAISQRPETMRWRLRGIDSVDQSIVFGSSLIKTLDTKNPFLDDLATYSRKPIAPVLLTVGVVPRSTVKTDGVTHPTGFHPFMDEGILLPGVTVHQAGEARPRHSMIPDPEDATLKDGPPEWYGAEAKTAASVAKARERRLASSLAKTIHVLRKTSAGKALIARVGSHSCARWQIEQAVCNLRVPAYLAYEPKGKTKRLAMIDGLRHEVVEPATAVFDPIAVSVETVLEQVALDCAYLLRRIDADRPLDEALSDRCARLKTLGYG